MSGNVVATKWNRNALYHQLLLERIRKTIHVTDAYTFKYCKRTHRLRAIHKPNVHNFWNVNVRFKIAPEQLETFPMQTKYMIHFESKYPSFLRDSEPLMVRLLNRWITMQIHFIEDGYVNFRLLDIIPKLPLFQFPMNTRHERLVNTVECIHASRIGHVQKWLITHVLSDDLVKLTISFLESTPELFKMNLPRRLTLTSTDTFTTMTSRLQSINRKLIGGSTATVQTNTTDSTASSASTSIASSRNQKIHHNPDLCPNINCKDVRLLMNTSQHTLECPNPKCGYMILLGDYSGRGFGY